MAKRDTWSFAPLAYGYKAINGQDIIIPKIVTPLNIGDGQVIFSLERVDDGSYDTDIYAYITYRNKSDGLKFLDAIKPKTATSDF